MIKSQKWIIRLVLFSLPLILSGVIIKQASWLPKPLQVLPPLAENNAAQYRLPISIIRDLQGKIIRKGMLRVVAVSPDHNFAITAFLTTKLNSPLQLWSISSNRLVAILVNTGSESDGLANSSPPAVFSPDGKFIGTAFGSYSDWNDVRLWDGRTGKLLRVLKGHQNAINLLSFTPDGKYIISRSRDRVVRKNGTSQQQNFILQMRVQ